MGELRRLPHGIAVLLLAWPALAAAAVVCVYVSARLSERYAGLFLGASGVMLAAALVVSLGLSARLSKRHRWLFGGLVPDTLASAVLREQGSLTLRGSHRWNRLRYEASFGPDADDTEAYARYSVTVTRNGLGLLEGGGRGSVTVRVGEGTARPTHGDSVAGDAGSEGMYESVGVTTSDGRFNVQVVRDSHGVAEGAGMPAVGASGLAEVLLRRYDDATRSG